MTFKDRLDLNREMYLSALKENKNLNREVATRNNLKNIEVAKYDSSITVHSAITSPADKKGST